MYQEQHSIRREFESYSVPDFDLVVLDRLLLLSNVLIALKSLNLIIELSVLILINQIGLRSQRAHCN